jgi:hypothetical protein
MQRVVPLECDFEREERLMRWVVAGTRAWDDPKHKHASSAEPATGGTAA